MHALVIDGLIRDVFARLPASARTLASGETITPVGAWTQEQAEACGFLAVVETPRPDDTDTDTHDWWVRLVEGIPTTVWDRRAKTPDEIVATNRSEIEASVEGMLTDLDALIAADAVPETAVSDLARNQRRIIRYLFGRLETAD